MREKVTKKKFFSLLSGKIDVIPYIQSHHTRYIYIINTVNKLFVSHIQPENVKVLDFGSHTGVLGIALKSLGYDMYCIDLDEVIEGHISKYLNNDINVEKLSANWEKLPYPDNHFDLVIFTEVLEHLYESPVKFLEEFKRILKPGGFLLITTPNVMRIENKLKFLLNINIYQDIERFCYEPRFALHYREYTKNDLMLLMSKYLDFTNLKFYFFDYVGGRTKTFRFIQRILFLFTKFVPSLRSSIVMTGQKPG